MGMMSVVMKEMHQRARQNKEKLQDAPKMRPVLGKKIEARNQQKPAHQKAAVGLPARRGRRTVVTSVVRVKMGALFYGLHHSHGT